MFDHSILTKSEIKGQAKAKLKSAVAKLIFFITLSLIVIGLLLSADRAPIPVLIIMVASLIGFAMAAYIFACVSILRLVNVSAETYLPLTTKFDGHLMMDRLNDMCEKLGGTAFEPDFKCYLKRVADTRGGLRFTNEEFEKLIEEVDEALSLQKNYKIQEYMNSRNNDKECVNV